MNASDSFHSTVHGYPGGHAALAVRLGMSAAILRNKANIHSTTNKPTLEDVDRIIGITGDASVLHALAENHGYVCTKVESEWNGSDMALLEMVTQVWTCNGDVGAEVNRALADGRVEQHEVVRIREAVYKTIQAMKQMVARLDLMVERPVEGGAHG